MPPASPASRNHTLDPGTSYRIRGPLVSELTIKPAIELLSMLQQRSMPSCELAMEHIQGIERLNPCLRAYADFDPDRLLHAAGQADDSRARSQRSGGDAPLLGLPISVKSSIATAGYRCETGTVLHRGLVAQDDAVAVVRMRQAGALILGTTNCPEFLMAYETDNLLYGATANPWSLQHSAGWSTGGGTPPLPAGPSTQRDA